MSGWAIAGAILATVLGVAGFCMSVSALSMPRAPSFYGARRVAWLIASASLVVSIALISWSSGANRMIPLTDRQKACLDAIAAHRRATGMMPSIDELRVALGLVSRTSVFRLLRALELRRAIARRKGSTRAIRILKEKCPHCGGVLEQTK